MLKDIIVVLIDDGVNIDIFFIGGKVIGGVIFDCGELDENGLSFYFIFVSGYGIVMVDMICWVCLIVKFYVFKLEIYFFLDFLVDG